ncbi:helix-turn-helix domain-containing protein [Psychrobacter sp. LV10R520-6]|uniref:helix-turn-helix domain-containing protein n=1 Tax=Psychrobacter sp. LV10R520-6 TaxID=1415574 RepID=UPI0024CCDCB4|nr:helix-turn-helix transcriptional regulator [Psychrobacter sp. LV10R520-6]SNT69891.1 Transcriptional regulator, contains XRE-family HTH domain [Psychrobacter sp. LV10R520-6]
MTIRFDFYTPNEIGEILGERLRACRLSLNLTQSTLADKAGVGVSTVARIESGQGGTLDNVIRLAIGLGMVNQFADLFEDVPTTIEDIIAKRNLRQRASNKN